MCKTPLILAARIFDANYPKDPNPENWRTINGAKVHIGEEQQIDGGAGGKFTGKEFGSNFSAEEGFSGKYAAPKKFHKKAKSLEFKTNASEPEPIDESANENIDYYLAKGNKVVNHQLAKMSEHDLTKISLEEAKEKLKAKKWTKAVIHEAYNKLNEMFCSGEYDLIDFELAKTQLDLFDDYFEGEVRNQIRAMTDYIERSAFDEDVWLQRGCAYGGMDKFLNLSKPLIQYSLEELKTEILGTKVTEHGFMSCGAAKNTGFSGNPVTFNIYAPAGTKMAYAANFSAYPDENEMILQRGTQFRVAKIEQNPKGGFFINLEVVGYNMQKV